MSEAQAYQQAVAAEAAQLRGLFAPAPEAGLRAGAGLTGGGLPPEELAQRADRLADITQRAGSLTVGALDTGTRAARDAAEARLMQQAQAQFRLAQGLLEAADEAAGSSAAGPTTRSARTVDVSQGVNELASILERPIDQVIPIRTSRGIGERPRTSDAAKADLQQEVEKTLRFICRQAGRIGGQAAQTLVLIDPSTLRAGVAYISKDAADAVEQIASGVARIARQLVVSAIRLIAQAYDWVRSLLGKEVEGKAREQVGAWLAQIKDGDKANAPGLVEVLVTRIYRPDAIGAEVAAWLRSTQSGVDKLNQAADTVEELGKRYETMSDQVGGFVRVVGLARVAPLPFTKTPQFQVLIAAVALSLLAYVVYAGHDHVTSGRISLTEGVTLSIPDRVEGVREAVQKALGAV